MRGSAGLEEFISGIVEKIGNIGMSFYNAFIPEQRYMAYLDGLKSTLEISFFAILIGIIIGIVVAITKVSVNGKKGFAKVLNAICNCYIAIVRGTPVVLQLLIIYNLIFTSKDANAILIGAICFGFNSGAYVAEIVRAGIESIDKGQFEAGRSLGFNNMQTMIYIIMPQAIKNILPALGNEFIVLVKETSVAGYIAVTDLTKAAQYIGSRTWDMLPPLVIAAAFYLVIVLLLTKVVSIFERRLSLGDKH